MEWRKCAKTPIKREDSYGDAGRWVYGMRSDRLSLAGTEWKPAMQNFSTLPARKLRYERQLCRSSDNCLDVSLNSMITRPRATGLKVSRRRGLLGTVGDCTGEVFAD